MSSFIPESKALIDARFDTPGAKMIFCGNFGGHGISGDMIPITLHEVSRAGKKEIWRKQDGHDLKGIDPSVLRFYFAIVIVVPFGWGASSGDRGSIRFVAGGVESITGLLRRSREGSSEATEQLLPMVYDRLRRLANHLMRSERPGHTLSATALVHEAYLRMIPFDQEWQDRLHFYAVAAKVMRRVLVDHARAQRRQKRGAGGERVTLDEAMLVGPQISLDLISLDIAMQKLAEQDPRKSEIVELMFFGGLTAHDVTQELNISEATLFRDLKLAKAFLYRELGTTEAKADVAAITNQ